MEGEEAPQAPCRDAPVGPVVVVRGGGLGDNKVNVNIITQICFYVATEKLK